MLTVTNSARDLLKEMLIKNSDDPETGMRLVVQPENRHFGLLLAKEQAGDQLIEHEGSKVLMVAPDLAPSVENMTLDVENTETGPTLVMTK